MGVGLDYKIQTGAKRSHSLALAPAGLLCTFLQLSLGRNPVPTMEFLQAT